MTDMTEFSDADTVIDSAIRDAVTDMSAVTMVTVEETATMSGVSVRTIRRWIQHGHLPYVEEQRGKIVSPADLPVAKERARQGHGGGHVTRPVTHDRRHDNMATDTDTAMTAPVLSSSAMVQMEAIRDQWLRPLVDRIEELSRENGRLEQERDSLRVELDQMRVALVDAPHDAHTSPVRDDPPAEASEGLIDRLRRLFGR